MPKSTTATDAPSGKVANPVVMTSANPVTIQLVQAPEQPKNTFWEGFKACAPYFAAAIALLGVFVALYQARMGARYTYASEILKFRLRQIQEFYAPAFLLIEESRIVYEKLLWTIAKEKQGGFPLDGFRLLDYMFSFKSDEKLEPLISRILETGEKLTKLISGKSGLIEGGLTPTFIEYQAHFAILNAASEQELSANQKEGWHEFGYYPRMLNREIREGFKVVSAHLENYATAGDRTIFRLLGQKPVEIGKYRLRLLENLAFYETHTSDYASKNDKFDMSVFRQRFIDEIKKTGEERSAALSEGILSILDAGCGTGRDTYEFLRDGYMVTAIDASPAMLRECRRKVRKARSDPKNEEMKQAAEASEKRCLEMTFDEIRFQNEFDGVWAAASLLHIPLPQMEENIRKLIRSLKPNGVLFMSFKYGHGVQKYGQRFYSCYGRKEIRALLSRISGTEEIKVWLSDSSGKDLPADKQRRAWKLELLGYYDRSFWLNVIVKRRYV